MERKAMKSISTLILSFLFSLSCFGQELANEHAIGKLEVVATFNGPMPTGVTVSNSGRIFVNFPKWGDNVEYTVAEVKDGKTMPYPNAEINRYEDGDNLSDKLVSVQSVVDPSGNRVWILDTASIGFGPTKFGGPKLLAVISIRIKSPKKSFPARCCPLHQLRERRPF
jgi:hypothetical protein